ncbi:cytochrome P450 monooxygenase-like protein [Hyaloscypha sp. PMI_1271]|nr:cytochrome P450 monooxygenase-like protein [Hyaloscypha sp. PMI_1271]
MANLKLEVAALVGTALGVASHLGYFIHGEHHMQATRIAAFFIIAPVLLFIVTLRDTDGHSYSKAGKITAVGTASYFTALSTSILIYRAFFHPLRRFPGPFSAKLSKITHVLRIAKDSKNYLLNEQMFDKYGEFVRTGPNELITNSPEAVSVILGISSKCTKAPWYECVSYPNTSLHLTRSRVEHDKRRKIWDRGFSAKALREYEHRVTGFTDDLISQLTSRSGEPVNVSRWMNYYAFDMMGDMAFGKSFDMLKTGEKHDTIELLQEGMAPLGVITPIPWILILFQDIPGLSAGPKRFLKYLLEQVAARKKHTPDSPDLFSWLIDAEKQSNDPIHKDPRWLNGDCGLIVVAGSDTTTATLTHVFYHLARSEEVFSKLRKELDSFYKPGSESEFRDLQEATYLNGVINEALRIHPPVPGGVLRVTPPEGITIGTTFIPGNVTISTPAYSLGRLESCYEKPSEFIPDRWGEKPEMVRDKGVFVPFSVGPYSCVGKQLALMELRNVIARIVTEFDVKFAPDEDGTALLEKSTDTFTIALAPLMLVFTKREV